MEERAAQAIQQLIRRRGEIAGRKVLQKLCYFVQEAEGTPLGLGFRMLHYGPYSDQLDETLWDLAATGNVTLEESPDSTLIVRPGALQELTEAPKEMSEAVDRVLTGLGQDGGLTLELLATCHFLARLTGYDGTPTARDEVVRRVEAWKGSKFQPYFIVQQLSKLERLGYLPTATVA